MSRKIELTADKILKASASCGQAAEALKILFPEVFEKRAIYYKILYRDKFKLLRCWITPLTIEFKENQILNCNDYKSPRGFMVYRTLEEAQQKRHYYCISDLEIWKVKVSDTIGNKTIEGVKHYFVKNLELIKEVKTK